MRTGSSSNRSSAPAGKRWRQNAGLRHGAVPARTADLAEVLPDELAGVPRVAKIPDGNHERLAHDPRHDRPLDVFQLQKEIGNVRDEVFPGRLAEECAEH